MAHARLAGGLNLLGRRQVATPQRSGAFSTVLGQQWWGGVSFVEAGAASASVTARWPGRRRWRAPRLLGF